MKLIFCFICCFLFSLHASIRAQKQMVTLKLEKTSVAEAIRELKQQTRLDFFFSNKEVNVKKTVSLNCENMRIDEVLQQLLGTEFQFEFVDNMVLSHRDSESPKKRQKVFYIKVLFVTPRDSRCPELRLLSKVLRWE